MPGTTSSQSGKNLRYPANIVPARACDIFFAARALCTMTCKQRDLQVDKVNQFKHDMWLPQSACPSKEGAGVFLMVSFEHHYLHVFQIQDQHIPFWGSFRDLCSPLMNEERVWVTMK